MASPEGDGVTGSGDAPRKPRRAASPLPSPGAGPEPGAKGGPKIPGRPGASIGRGLVGKSAGPGGASRKVPGLGGKGAASVAGKHAAGAEAALSGGKDKGLVDGAKGAISAAKTGAKIGSAVPGIGTAAGAAVGAALAIRKNPKMMVALVIGAIGVPLLIPLMVIGLIVTSIAPMASGFANGGGDESSVIAAAGYDISEEQVQAYEDAAEETGVPWEFLAAIPLMEPGGQDDSGLAGSVTATNTGNGASFGVAAFNLLGASHTNCSPSDSDCQHPTWSSGVNRAQPEANLVNSSGVSLLGTNENTSAVLSALKNDIGDQWNWYIGPGSSPDNAMAWNSNVWKADHDARGAMTFDYYQGSQKQAPWVLLTNKTSGQQVIFMNIHLPSPLYKGGSVSLRDQALAKLARYWTGTLEKAYPNIPLVLTGDMNHKSFPCAFLPKVKDGVDSAGVQVSAAKCTGSNKNKDGDVWIEGTNDIAWSAYNDDGSVKDSHVSDHYYVTATATVTAAGTPTATPSPTAAPAPASPAPASGGSGSGSGTGTGTGPDYIDTDKIKDSGDLVSWWDDKNAHQGKGKAPYEIHGPDEFNSHSDWVKAIESTDDETSGAASNLFIGEMISAIFASKTPKLSPSDLVNGAGDLAAGGDGSQAGDLGTQRTLDEKDPQVKALKAAYVDAIGQLPIANASDNAEAIWQKAVDLYTGVASSCQTTSDGQGADSTDPDAPAGTAPDPTDGASDAPGTGTTLTNLVDPSAGASDGAQAPTLASTIDPLAAYHLTKDQKSNAQLIVNASGNYGGAAAAVIAIMVSIDESGLVNLDHGLGTAVGLFQQEDGSTLYGTRAQRMDPSHAAAGFYTELNLVQGWQTLDPWVAAQKTQRSGAGDPSNSYYQRNGLTWGYGGNYKRFLTEATDIVQAMGGGTYALSTAGTGCDGSGFSGMDAMSGAGDFTPNPNLAPGLPSGWSADTLNWAADQYAGHTAGFDLTFPSGTTIFTSESYEEGRCQHFVAEIYGHTGSGYDDAHDGWNLRPLNQKHPWSGADGMAPPIGAWLYYSGGSHGHVVVYLGNNVAISTDTDPDGSYSPHHVSKVSMATAWFLDDGYLGWTPPLVAGAPLPAGSPTTPVTPVTGGSGGGSSTTPTSLPPVATWLSDVTAAEAGATDYLASARKPGTKQAIVLDIDNTSIQTKYAWPKAVPATLALAKYATSKGYKVYFVTGRYDADAASTVPVLTAAGYTVAAVYGRHTGEALAKSKKRNRKTIADAGYQIVMDVGNNDTDFKGANVGKAVELPNYGGLLS